MAPNRHTAVSVLDHAQRLVTAGRRDEAIALVRNAASGGDVEALYALANWRLFGLFVPRDLDEAHRLFDQGVASGHADAIRTKAALLANGTGCSADPAQAAALLGTIRESDTYAARQLAMLEQMHESEGASAALSREPVIKVFRKLLSAHECDYLIALAEPQLQPSFVINPNTGRRMPHPVRTSMGMNFGPTSEDLVVRRLNERLARVSDTDVACGEPLHVLRYTPGQEYRPHNDALPGEMNQRDWTVLVYLNSGYRGGGTQFDRIGVEFAGGPGDALIFRNVDAVGQPEPLTRHAGLPVLDGVKWLATRWIRRNPIQF